MISTSNIWSNAAGYFNPKPFMDHNNQDFDTYAELNRATFFISPSRGEEHDRQWRWINRAYIGSMWGKQAVKATPLIRLFDGKGRTTRADATHGHGTRRTQHSRQCRVTRRGQNPPFTKPSSSRISLMKPSQHSMAFTPSDESAHRTTLPRRSTSSSATMRAGSRVPSGTLMAEVMAGRKLTLSAKEPEQVMIV